MKGCATIWADGPRTYLGLGVDGFPNLFLVSGPGAPAVLANMVLHAEAHVNWIADCINYLDEHGHTAIEATPDAVDNWIAECAQRADATLFPKANSWYMGANMPGKPRCSCCLSADSRSTTTSVPRSPTPATRVSILIKAP